MSIGTIRLLRRALLALGALAVSVALLGTSGVPALADWPFPGSRVDGWANRDVDIGTFSSIQPIRRRSISDLATASTAQSC